MFVTVTELEQGLVGNIYVYKTVTELEQGLVGNIRVCDCY